MGFPVMGSAAAIVSILLSLSSILACIFPNIFMIWVNSLLFLAIETSVALDLDLDFILYAVDGVSSYCC